MYFPSVGKILLTIAGTEAKSVLNPAGTVITPYFSEVKVKSLTKR